MFSFAAEHSSPLRDLCITVWFVENPTVLGSLRSATPTIGALLRSWCTVVGLVQSFAGRRGNPPLQSGTSPLGCAKFFGRMVGGWWAVDSCTCTFRKKRIVPLLGTMRFSYTYEMPRVYFFTVVFLLAVFFAAGCFADVDSAFFALGAAGFALSAGNADLVCQISRA